MRPDTHLALLDPRRSWIGFLLCAGLVLTLLFTFLNPQASNGLSVWSRALFWGFHVALPLSFAQAAQVLLARRASLPVWPAIVMSGVIAALVFAPIANVLDMWFPIVGDDPDPAALLAVDLADEFFSLAPPVVLCWAALNAVRGVRLSAPESPLKLETPKLFRLLRSDLRPGGKADIVALSAELHYTRVFTPLGEELVLYPLNQAILEAGEGVQIHRSHWVARAHVEALRKETSGWVVTLDTGLRLPVARARRKDVELALST